MEEASTSSAVSSALTLEMSYLEKKQSPESLTETEPIARDPNDPETNWRLLTMASLVMFLGSIEGTIIGQPEWPYMKEVSTSYKISEYSLDRQAAYLPSSFFGLCTSFSQLGHAVFAIIFSYWTYKTNSVKGPLQAGRILAQIAGTLYLCVELFPQNRKFVMMTCYICFGVASSSATVMRVYMVYVSSKANRVRAYSCMSFTGLLSIIIGPLFEMIFALVPYPGWQIFPGIALNIYSAPIWMAWVINAGSMLLIHYTLVDIPRDAHQEGFGWTCETFIEKLRVLRGPGG